MTRAIASQTPARRTRTGSLRLRGILTAAALAAVSLAAALPATGQDASPSAAAPAASAAALTWPLTLVDDEGTSVTLDALPVRVISLSPGITETLFALGAGDRVVGGTDFDDHPPEAVELPDVATFQGVRMEQVVALEPDLVIAAGNNFTPATDIDRMRELGYPVIVVYAESVDQVVTDIELIGDAVGERDAARDITASMRADIDQITAAVAATGTRPRTFYQIGSEPEIYAPAPDSFVADIVALAGGEPITTTDPNVFSIPVEQLVAADPEVIVVGDAMYGVCPSDVSARPGWDVMTAVREDAVRAVNDTPITRPGPRLAQGLANLARAIHPALDLGDIPVDAPPCVSAGSPVVGSLAVR